MDQSAPLGASSGDAVTASITLSTLSQGVHEVAANYLSNSSNFTASSTPETYATTTVGGFGDGPYQFSGDGGSATAAVLNDPQGVAVDAHGDLFIADAYDNVVREVTPAGIITTVAGDGAAGYSGDGGPAITAALNDPTALAVDASGRPVHRRHGQQRHPRGDAGPNGLLSLGTISTLPEAARTLTAHSAARPPAPR